MNRFLLFVWIAFYGLAPGAMSALKGPCEDDLEKLCSNVQPGQGRMAACLDRYKEMLSKECTDYLAKSSDALKTLRTDCAEDAHEYCRDVKASFRRIVHCLEEHVNDLRPACRAKMMK